MARHGENIRKRKDGRWEARWLCGYREDGRAIYRSFYGKTYTAVKETRNRVMSQNFMNGGTFANSRKVQTRADVGNLLAEWLVFVKPQVKESTYSRYTAIVENHLRPELGSILLTELTTEDIDAFIRKKLNRGNLRTGGRLSSKTVTGFLSVMRLALNYGAERGRGCTHLIVIRNPRRNPPEIRIFTREEQQTLERMLLEEDSRIAFGIFLSLYLGLRIGEVCGLRWEDWDGPSRLLSVRRSVQRIPVPGDSGSSKTKTRLIIGTPKTYGSLRRIPIPSFLLPFFVQYRTSPECYILTGTGCCMEPRQYDRKYKRILEKCGLGHFNYHALRHTFATRCLENHFDLKSLSEILGHTNVSTTLQKYVHPSLHVKRNQMEQLGKISFCGQNSGQKRENGSN